MFRSSVDEQNLPAISKFNYLKSTLKGPTLSMVQGLPVTAQNYTVAVDLLRERFGRKDVVIESLYSRLQGLPMSGSKFKEIQHVFETTEELLYHR